MKLEEIEKKFKEAPVSLTGEEIEWIFTKLHRLKGAIEKHRKVLERQMEIGEIDEELYKSLEDL